MVSASSGSRPWLTEPRIQLVELLSTVPMYAGFLLFGAELRRTTETGPVELLIVFGVAVWIPGTILAGIVGSATLIRYVVADLASHRFDATLAGAFLVGMASLFVAIALSFGTPDTSAFLTLLAGIVAVTAVTLFARVTRRAMRTVRAGGA